MHFAYIIVDMQIPDMKEQIDGRSASNGLI